MKKHYSSRRAVSMPSQENKRSHSSWRGMGSWLALSLLLLALAACSPGASTNTGSNPPATATRQTAPIHVPQGYKGMIVVSFDTSVTYAQAKAAVESAGLTLAVPCPNAGPIREDATPKPTDQSDSFPTTHKLTAVGDPSLTTTMLNQIAAQSGVTSVDEQPPVECPLIP